MDTMPSNYETQKQETTEETSPAISINALYIRTVPGILKIVQVVINVIILICISVRFYSFTSGGGWTSFVCGLSMVISILLFLLYLTNFIQKLPPQRILGEMIALLVCGGLHLIAMIVMAAQSWYSASVVAGAVFAAMNTAAYFADVFLRFRVSRETTGSTTTTTVTTSHPA